MPAPKKMLVPCHSVVLDLLSFRNILALRATCRFYLEAWLEYRQRYEADFQLVYPSRCMVLMTLCMFCEQFKRPIHSSVIRWGSFPRGVFVYCDDCMYHFVLNYRKFAEQHGRRVIINRVLPTACEIPRSDGTTTEGFALECGEKGVLVGWETGTRYYEKVLPWKKISPQLMAKPRFLEYL